MLVLVAAAGVLAAADVDSAGAALLLAAGRLLATGFAADVVAGAEVFAAAEVAADDDAEVDAERLGREVVELTDTGETPALAFDALLLPAPAAGADAEGPPVGALLSAGVDGRSIITPPSTIAARAMAASESQANMRPRPGCPTTSSSCAAA